MSSTNAPSVNQDLPLGLAQIEELQSALYELKMSKANTLGPGKFRTVAFTETFRSQGEYTMASGFDEVGHVAARVIQPYRDWYRLSIAWKIYCQPTGEIPLVGINSTVTFYSKLLNWLGIKVHAEARTKYKSMVCDQIWIYAHPFCDMVWCKLISLHIFVQVAPYTQEEFSVFSISLW